jgi:hypothetical protein
MYFAPMDEVLKQMQSDLAALKEGQRETNSALNAIRIHIVCDGTGYPERLRCAHAARE